MDGDLYDISLEDVDCPNGCARMDKSILKSCDLRHGLPGYYDIVQCQQCGLMRTNPRPTQDTIGFYYPDDYGPYLGTIIPDSSIEAKTGFKQQIKTLLSNRSHALPEIGCGNLLEVGCASGMFLSEMASKGWNVQGIEYSETAAENARKSGFEVFCGALEEAPRPRVRMDLVVAWMVLEHLHDPKSCLGKLQEWTAEDGYLVLSVPDINSLGFRLFKQYSYDLHLPNHLYFFCPDTLRGLLESTGWEVEKIIHQVTLSSLIGSFGYWLRGVGRKGRVSEWCVEFPGRGGNLPHLLFPLSWLLAKLRLTGRMTVWARKKSD